MTETQLRFLRAIGERLPLGRVAELYLFPPMRQGNAESGIAVIAAVSGESGIGNGESGPSEQPPIADATTDGPPDVDAEACDPTEDASRDDLDVVAVAHAGEDAESEEASIVDGAHDATEVAAAADATVAEDAEDADAEAPVPDSRFPIADSRGGGSAAARRHTVYTARYRLTLKGPERGKWELNVVEEADAPLLSVEMVVRGVQHRAGEGAEPERLETPALRELLETPAR